MRKVRIMTGHMPGAPKRILHIITAGFAAFALILCLNGCSGSQSIEVTRLEDMNIPGMDESGSEAGYAVQNRSGSTDMPGSSQMAQNSRIAVYVKGAVRKPGVYYLDEGARIYQAVEAAGGFAPDADTEWLNQAQMLKDGQMLTVNTLQETSEMEKEGKDTYPEGTALSDSGQGSAGSGESGGLVNLNTADKEELMTLPGIGESKAESIIRYREENGAFASSEDVMNISGIKEAVFSKIKDRICV